MLRFLDLKTTGFRLAAFLLFVGSFLQSSCQNGYTRDPRTEIPIYFRFDTETVFHESWYEPPINGKVVLQENVTEGVRQYQAVTRAMEKYPITLLKEQLSAVYCVRDLQFYGVGYGATYYQSSLFLCNEGAEAGYSNEYLERVFHHEFSSVLLNDHEELLGIEGWNRLLPANFEYGSGGADAIIAGTSDTDVNDSLNALGFVSQYSLAEREEDFNMIAENLFRPKRNFWFAVDKHTLLRKKVSYVIRFYTRLNSRFTEDYFRKLDK